MRPHRIGIITGSGPEAGIDLWGKVLDEHRSFLGDRYRGDIDAPETVIISLPDLGYSMDLEHQEDRVWVALKQGAERIADQVDVYVIACNTLNYFADRLRALELPAVLITPVETVIDELESRGTTNVALLGSRQTMDLDGWSSYRELSDRVQIELPQDISHLHNLIEQVKISGGSTPEIERGFAELRQRLRSETVLLACTELPLLHGADAQEETGAIDVSRLLARAAVRWQPIVIGSGQPTVMSESPISVIYTGGTFGMVASDHGLTPNPQLRGEIESLMAGLKSSMRGDVRWTYSQTERVIDSAEVDALSLGVLADLIRERVTRDQSRAVLVIHGTDSMAYSAAFAAFALADIRVPIIFTGSQLPLGVEGSDAASNFELAFESAMADLNPGVWIAFGDSVLPAVRSVKRSSESFSAFAATRGLAEGNVGIDEQLTANLQTAVGRDAPRIGLVKIGPGLTARQLEAVLDDCPVGVVLECYGFGTAPMRSGGLAGPVRKTIERGGTVLVVTQCADGPVDLHRYEVSSQLAEAGALSGGDMTTETALGKLGALTRAGYQGQSLRELLESNLIGERSD